MIYRSVLFSMTLSEPWFRFHSHIVTTLQEILRRDDDVVRTSCTGPNDVIFRRSDDVESWTPDQVSIRLRIPGSWIHRRRGVVCRLRRNFTSPSVIAPCMAPGLASSTHTMTPQTLHCICQVGSKHTHMQTAGTLHAINKLIICQYVIHYRSQYRLKVI